jgi:hypothetical protein
VMDIAALKAAAERATPGPWHNSHGSVDNFGNEWQGSLSFEWMPNGRGTDGDGINENFANDAAYIALANPTSILSMIARLEALEEALSACAHVMPHYRMMGATPGHDEELDAVLERATEALSGVQS